MHDDVINWKHFPRYWPFARGIHRSPVNSPHKGRWRGALMFSLICNWINGWVSHRETGDLKQHHAHYDVIIMWNNFLLPQNFPEQMVQPGRLWFDNLPRSPADNIHKTKRNTTKQYTYFMEQTVLFSMIAHINDECSFSNSFHHLESYMSCWICSFAFHIFWI